MKRLFAFIVFILLSCGSNTSIISTWRDPDTTIQQGDYKKVLIVALLKNESVRRTVEDRAVFFNPTNFRVSYNLVTPETVKLTSEQKLQLLTDENFDGIVTMRLVDITQEVEYVPGTTQSHYNGFHGWYGSYYNSYSTPSYYETNKYYIVETCLFSVKQNKLIWSGTTKTIDVENIGATVDSILQTLYDEMRFKGFIKTKTK